MNKRRLWAAICLVAGIIFIATAIRVEISAFQQHGFIALFTKHTLWRDLFASPKLAIVEIVSAAVCAFSGKVVEALGRKPWDL